MCLNFLYNCICNDRYFIMDALSWGIPIYLFLLSFMFMPSEETFGFFILCSSLIMLFIRTCVAYNDDDE